MSAGRLARPFDIDALVHVLNLRPSNESGRVTVSAIALALGVERVVVYRARHQGLTVDQADRLACHAGLHPGFVWEEWWSLAETDDWPGEAA